MKKRYAIEHRVSSNVVKRMNLKYNEIDEIIMREVAIKAIKEMPIALLKEFFNLKKEGIIDNSISVGQKENLEDYFYTQDLKPTEIIYRGIITIEIDE